MVALVCGVATAWAQPTGPIISEIRIQGNQRVEADAIKIHISSRAGQPLDQATVDADIKAIYKMGFFDHVSADVEHQGSTVVLTYLVQERPLITDVRFGGMKAIKSNDDKIIKVVKLHGGFGARSDARRGDDPGDQADLSGEGLSRRQRDVSHRAASKQYGNRGVRRRRGPVGAYLRGGLPGQYGHLDPRIAQHDLNSSAQFAELLLRYQECSTRRNCRTTSIASPRFTTTKAISTFTSPNRS